jgi:hypothetical protein
MKRPRFSLRTLAIVVTLICAYFGAWEATKRYGVQPTELEILENEGRWVTPDDLGSSYAVIPFVIAREERVGYSKRYYLWLLGPLVKLPFESPLELSRIIEIF